MPSEDNGDPTSVDRDGDRAGTPVSPLWARRLALAALIVGVLGLCVSTVRAVLRPKAQDRIETPAAAAPASAIVAATPAVFASAAPTASAVADSPKATAAAASSSEKESPPHATARFDARAARAALDALAPTLTDCNIPKGRSGKVEVVFEPDGHISSAKPLDMYVGTFGGKCVARHLKQARVPAYYGPTTPYTHAFIIPE